MVDGALNPLIAFGLWNRTKVNAVLSNKVEHIVFESFSKMKTLRAEGNAFDVSSLNNTDLCSNEALAHEMKEYAKLLNNIDTNVEFVCQDLQALWADSEHGPRVKFTGKDDAVVAGFMDRSHTYIHSYKHTEEKSRHTSARLGVSIVFRVHCTLPYVCMHDPSTFHSIPQHFSPEDQEVRRLCPPRYGHFRRVRQEHKRRCVRSSTRAEGQDRSDRSTRHKRQQAGHGCLRKSGKSSGSDDASLSCGRNHGVSC